MNKILLVGLLSAATFLVGCGDGLTDREESCLEATGNIQCKSKAELELELARIQGNTDVQVAKAQADAIGSGYQDLPPADTPVQPGNYTNYYGDERYGQWKPDGTFQFNDPTSSWASETNAFLIGAGLGGLAGYIASKAATRGEWKKTYPTGYKPTTRKVETYIDKKGNPISKNEYQKRLAQSNKDRMKYQQEQRRKKFNPNEPKPVKKPVQNVYRKPTQPLMVKPGQPNPNVKVNTPIRKEFKAPKPKTYSAPKVKYGKKRR